MENDISETLAKFVESGGEIQSMNFENKLKAFVLSVHKQTFILMILGLCIYSPFIAHQLNSADVNVYGYLYHWAGYQYEDALGRFFIKYLVEWRNDINSNVLIIPLCIVLLSLVSEIVTLVFDIKSVIGGFLTGCFIVFAPGVANLFSYVYTADVYCFAYLLSALAAYFLICKEGWKYKLLSALCIILSLGIYQTFIGFTLMIIIIWLLRELLVNCSSNDKGIWAEIKVPFMKALVAGVIAGISMIAYLLIFNILDKIGYLRMEHTRGSDSMLGDFIRELPRQLREAYSIFYNYFVTNEMNYNSWFARRYQNILLFILLLVMVAFLVVQKKAYKNVLRLLLIIAIVAALPIVFCVIVLLAPNTSVYAETGPLMLIYMQGIFIPAIVISDKLICPDGINKSDDDKKSATKEGDMPSRNKFFYCLQAFCKLMSVAMVITMLVFIEVFAKEVELDQNQLTLLANRMVYTLESRSDYEPHEKVLVVGRPHDGNYPLPDETFELITKNMISHYSQIFGAPDQISRGWIKAFDYYVGVKFTEVSPEEAESLWNSEEVREMGIYPAESSVQKIGDVTVIKLSE